MSSRFIRATAPLPTPSNSLDGLLFLSFFYKSSLASALSQTAGKPSFAPFSRSRGCQEPHRACPFPGSRDGPDGLPALPAFINGARWQTAANALVSGGRTKPCEGRLTERSEGGSRLGRCVAAVLPWRNRRARSGRSLPDDVSTAGANEVSDEERSEARRVEPAEGFGDGCGLFRVAVTRKPTEPAHKTEI